MVFSAFVWNLQACMKLTRWTTELHHFGPRRSRRGGSFLSLKRTYSSRLQNAWNLIRWAVPASMQRIATAVGWSVEWHFPSKTAPQLSYIARGSHYNFSFGGCGWLTSYPLGKPIPVQRFLCRQCSKFFIQANFLHTIVLQVSPGTFRSTSRSILG